MLYRCCWMWSRVDRPVSVVGFRVESTCSIILQTSCPCECAADHAASCQGRSRSVMVVTLIAWAEAEAVELVAAAVDAQCLRDVPSAASAPEAETPKRADVHVVVFSRSFSAALSAAHRHSMSTRNHHAAAMPSGSTAKVASVMLSLWHL